MKVLVIDTALGACTVGVFDDDQPLAVCSEIMSKGHAEKIGGLVRDVVAQAGSALGGFDALDRIGVTIGPGSFTGLRVGLAFAQGLGGALDIPVVGISTLAALARSKTVSDPDFGVAAAIDARRGQVYLQTFHGSVPDAPAEALSTDAAHKRLFPPAGAVWSFVGTGFPIILEDFMRRHGSARPDPQETTAALAKVSEDAIINPTAEALAALTIAADPADCPPTPLYLRAPDAIPPTRLPGQPRPAPVSP